MPTSLIGPYIASHAAGIAFLALAFRWPVSARWVLGVVFLLAGLINGTLAFANPGAYQVLAQWAFDPMAELITGPFAASPSAFLLLIALGQAGIAALVVFGRARGSFAGLVAAAAFFIAIAPLGFGSAFPATLLVALGVLLLLRTDLRQSLIDSARGYFPPPRHPVHTLAELHPRARAHHHLVAPAASRSHRSLSH